MLRFTLQCDTDALEVLLLSRSSKGKRIKSDAICRIFDALSGMWECSVRDWDKFARGLLKAEMAKRNMKAPDLAEALAKIGVEGRADALRNKIARGQFTATFFLQCLEAMEVKTLHLD